MLTKLTTLHGEEGVREEEHPASSIRASHIRASCLGCWMQLVG